MEIYLRSGEGYVVARIGVPNQGEYYFPEWDIGTDCIDIQRAGYPSSHYNDGLSRVILRKMEDADWEYSDDESVNRRILSYPQLLKNFIRTGVKREPKHNEWFLKCGSPQQGYKPEGLEPERLGEWEILELLEPEQKTQKAQPATTTHRLKDAFFGETGEVRHAQAGEWYMDCSETPCLSQHGTNGAYVILKILNGEGVRFDAQGNIV